VGANSRPRPLHGRRGQPRDCHGQLFIIGAASEAFCAARVLLVMP
jgi:hypothetical protein